MATLGDKTQLEATVNLDGKQAKKTLSELQKLVITLNKDIDSTGKKFSVAAKNFNKMLSSSLTRYNWLLGRAGAKENGDVMSALAFQKQQSKQMNSLYSVNPNRANAQLAQINNKIAKDAAVVFTDTFTKNLDRYVKSKTATGVRGFDAGLFASSGAYRSMVKQGFGQLENQLLTKIMSGEKVKTHIKQLEKLKSLYASTVEPIEQNIKVQEKLKTVSTGALALIQTRLIANYAVINSVTSAFSYLTKYVIEFDQELKNLQAIVNVSDVGLNKLKDSIIDVANSTKFTSLELTKTAVVLGQAGLSIQQIKDTLGPIAKLATATGTDLATSTQTITSALNIYNLQADEAAYITNALTTAMNESKAEIRGFQYSLQYAGNTAANLGVSFEETAAATAALAQSGIKSVSTQGTGLRAIFTELIKPTQKFKDQLAKVGLTTADVDVKTKGFIPVLKTLKEAGFGVTEAYRGMERRGAAAMVAIMNQTEFMDDLTEKMSLSTAGAKANETQMKGLANTFKNTQSVMGSLVHEGFEPLVKATQSLLENFNEMAKSGLGKVVGYLVMLGGAAAGITVAAKAIVGMINALRAASGLSAAGGLLGAIAGGSMLKVTGIVAGFGLLLTVIGKLAEKFNLLGTSYDEALGNLEDEQGKLSKAEEAYKSFTDVVSKAFTQREKFAGPDGQRELDKFVNMIRTRFPQISSYLEKPINSFEELTEVLMRATAAMSGFVATSTGGTPKAARELLNQASKSHSKGRGPAGLSSDINLLKSAGIISSGDIKAKSGFFGTSNYGTLLAEALHNSHNRNAGGTERAIRALLSDASKEIGDELRTVLESFLKEVEVNNKVRNNRIDSLLNQKLGPTIFGTLNNSSATLNSMRGSYNDMLSGGGLTQAGVSALLAQAEGNYKYLSDESSLRNIITSQISSEELRRIAKETDSTVDEVVDQGVKILKNHNKEILAQHLNFIEDLTKKDEEANKASSDATLQEANRRFNNIVKNLKNTSQNELDRKQEEALAIAERTRKLKIAELDKDLKNGKIFKEMYDQQVADITDAYDEQVDRIKGEVASVKENFDRIAKSQKDYFESISTAIGVVDSLYSRGMDSLEADFAALRGSSAAFGSVGLSGAQAGVENKISLGQRANYARKLAIMTQARAGYSSQLNTLNNINSNGSLDAAVARTKAELDKLTLSGSATVKELTDAEKAYHNAVAEQKKHTDLTNDLNEKILDLDTSIEELKATIDTVNMLSGSDDPLGSARLGIQGAIANYAENNPYLKNKDMGGNYDIAQLMEGTFTATITEAESALTNFFDVAINGTKSTGDAFKDMCQSILKAMEQALYSEIAKKFIAMLFSGTGTDGSKYGQMSETSSGILSFVSAIAGAFGAGSTATTTPSGGSSVFVSQEQALATRLGYSHGGLVTGGVANRDSVAAALMPGEYVMRKSAVDALGTDFLARLNSGNTDIIGAANQTMHESGDTGSGKKSSTLNIWVVTPDQVPQENPDNIIMTVSKDIQTNGSIKKLIKQVSMGAL